MTNKKPFDPTELRQFTGTENWYQHALVRSITYTEGAKYVADAAGAHWLLDKVATLQVLPAVKAEEFQVWKLKVAPAYRATLTCEDGNGNMVHREEIAWTDFPEPGVDLWFCNNVIYVPDEH